MAPAKQKRNASGLGRSIIKHRAEQSKREYQSLLHTTELPAGMNSVTHENDLDEFLNSAQLADTDFTAERRNVTVLPTTTPTHNPYLLTPEQERDVRRKHRDNRKRLRVPRRPPWTREMKKEELERSERDSFLEWRRGLADLSEGNNLLLTPFERNLSIWRQLWRTIERSHLIVQIVDARNPLGFRCEDLEQYVDEVRAGPEEEAHWEDVEDDVGSDEDGTIPPARGRRRNLLLVNKADLLTRRQRRIWARFFRENGIAFAFFSALDATLLQEEAAKEDNVEHAIAAMRRAQVDEPGPSSVDGLPSDASEGLSKKEDEALERAARVLTVEEVEALFLSEAPDPQEFIPEDADEATRARAKLTVGLVGYPNVGKSSTINALVGAKKVSVSATPGKTKNFQTIHLSDDLVLCDCPGLVFPQFAATNADLVCDGVLPIDQMREHTAPVTLVTQRVPLDVLEATYGLRLNLLPKEEGGTGVPTASELLASYAVARGFFTSGQGNPDESRASRYILKDYVAGKLLYAHPPPDGSIAPTLFNAEARDLDRLRLLDRVRAKRAPVTRVGQTSDTYLHPQQQAPASQAAEARPSEGRKASRLDETFFADAGQRDRPIVLGVGANASGNTARASLVPNGTGGTATAGGKKHFKANKRQKQRSGAGYD